MNAVHLMDYRFSRTILLQLELWKREFNACCSLTGKLFPNTEPLKMRQCLTKTSRGSSGAYLPSGFFTE